MKKIIFVLQLAYKELKNNFRFSLLFILNLSLGLSGFILLNSFHRAITVHLDAQSQQLLGADLALSGRRPLTSQEISSARTIIGQFYPRYQWQQNISMYSMAMLQTNTGNNSRLIELKAIFKGFPYYGQLVLRKRGRVNPGDIPAFFAQPIVWVYPEVLAQFKIALGESLKIGNQIFKVDDVVEQDSAGILSGFSLAPRAYIAQSFLPATGLVQKGSTITYSYLVKLPHNLKSDMIKKALEEKITDPAISVRTAQNASEETGRSISYLNDYLGLVSLVALFLSLLGAGYLFHSYLSLRIKEVAILLSLGGSAEFARWVYIGQLLMMSFGAALISIGLNFPLLSAIQIYFLPLFLKIDLNLHLDLLSFLGSFVIAIAGSLLICVPLLSKLTQLKPIQLLKDSQLLQQKFSARRMIYFIPAVIIFSLLALWQAHSWKVGLLFVGLFAGAIIIFVGTGFLFFKILNYFLTRGRWPLSVLLVLRNLARHKLGTLSALLALGLGSLLMSLIPQLRENIQLEINPPADLLKPGLFLFDIQEEQLPELQAMLKKNKAQLSDVSPLIRARLLRVNQTDFSKEVKEEKFKTREQEQETRLRNRGVNISYRNFLNPAEKILSGKFFTKPFKEQGTLLPEVSVEETWAEALHVVLGDTVSFDIQGIEISAQVTSIRKVRWNSFKPNFFILLQPGVLDEAPKTYLAALPIADELTKNDLQAKITSQFSNISMVDISRVIERYLNIFNQMSLVVLCMAFWALLSGLLVLSSITLQQLYTRKNEINLLKVLGASFGLIKTQIVGELLLIATLGAAGGIFLSLIMSIIISKVLLDGAWTVNGQSILLCFVLVLSMTGLLAFIIIRRVLNLKPLELLKESAQ